MNIQTYMYFCPNCGKQVNDSDRMCLKCGANMHEDISHQFDQQLVVDNSKRKMYRFLGETVFCDTRDRADVAVHEIALINDPIMEYVNNTGEEVLTFTGHNSVLGAKMTNYTCKVYKVYMYDLETDSHRFPYYVITGDVFYPKKGFYLLDKYIKSITKSTTGLFFTFEKDNKEDVRLIDGVNNVQAVYNQLIGYLNESRNFRVEARKLLDDKFNNIVNTIKNKYHAFEAPKYYSLRNQDDPYIEIVGLKKAMFAFYIVNRILYILDEGFDTSIVRADQDELLKDINRCYMINVADVVSYKMEGEYKREEIVPTGLASLFNKNKQPQIVETDTRKLTLTTKLQAIVFTGKHVELIERIFDDFFGDKKI